MKPSRPSRGGYIALTSALVMTAVVGILVFTLSFASHFSRANVATLLYKEKGSALAEACVQVALLRLSQNSGYAGGETVTVGSDTCQILAIALEGSYKIIKTTASFKDAGASFKVTVNANDLSIVAWEEVPTF